MSDAQPHSGPPILGDVTPVLYTELAGTMLLIWEHAITFNAEVERIWKRKKSLFTVYWVLLRYLPLLTRVLLLIASHKGNWTRESCSRMALAIPVFQSACLALAHVSLLLRTYALYDRRKLVFFPLAAIILAEVALDIYPVARPGAADTAVPKPVCFAYLWSPAIVIAQLSTSLTFDTAALVLVLARCAYLTRKQGLGTPSIVRVLVRDGIGYFGVVFASHLTNIFLLLYTDLRTQQSFVKFSLVIPSLMVNRMLLSLRAMDPPSKHDISLRHTVTLTSPHSILSDIVDGHGDEYDDGQWRTQHRLHGWTVPYRDM